MTDPRGFLKYARREPEKEPVAARVHHAREFERALPVLQAREQAARCMGCGVPFCHAGCPLGNAIPDWNEHLREGRLAEALLALEATNNFPEITGRVCPAPCEAACVAGMADPKSAVAIKAIERAIADHAAASGLEPVAAPPVARSGKRVAIVGSGPAGLACAEQLARAGHDVVVYERDDRVGGLLRYGIPDFKLEKSIVDARVRRLEARGVVFQMGVEIGRTMTLTELRAGAAAVVLAVGATVPRDLPIPGRDARGVHFAMDYLVEANRAAAGARDARTIDAAGKRVLVIGGGDTGSDCVGTAHRQGAASVTQIELLPRPPDERAPETPWPLWPMVMRTSSSQEEGGARDFAVRTTRFLVGDGGTLTGVAAERLARDGSGALSPVPDSGFVIPADLVLLAIGFSGPDTARLGAPATANATDFETGAPGIFSCGDARRGQSLVVWAIWEGREAARRVDAFLMGETQLPTSPLLASP